MIDIAVARKKRMQRKSGSSVATSAAIVLVRSIRSVWPIVFLVPLGVFAGRFCNLSLADPIYHALLAAHEHINSILIGLAALSLASVAVSAAVSESSLNVLLQLSCEPPEELRLEFEQARERMGVKSNLLYLDMQQRIAFPHWRANAVVVSAGMLQDCSAEEIRLVLLHEIAHLRRRDQYRALAWRVFFAIFILPGFSAVEQLLNRNRESAVDARCLLEHADVYRNLLQRSSVRRDKLFGSICTPGIGIPGLSGLNASPHYLADRTLPAAISIGVLALVLFSQILFLWGLPFLSTHHC